MHTQVVPKIAYEWRIGKNKGLFNCFSRCVKELASRSHQQDCPFPIEIVQLRDSLAINGGSFQFAALARIEDILDNNLRSPPKELSEKIVRALLEEAGLNRSPVSGELARYLEVGMRAYLKHRLIGLKRRKDIASACKDEDGTSKAFGA